MESKSLLYGLIGFFLGGLLVSIAAGTANQQPQIKGEMTMGQMVESLSNKDGEDYDKTFVAEMIHHHQGAVDMAKLSATRAKHNEIKQLSKNIIAAQEKEIQEMKQWQVEWGYSSPSASSMKGMSH